MNKTYVRQDTKIGNLAPILNRTTPNYVSLDRMNVPPGYSADWSEMLINRKLEKERTSKDYLTGTLGHTAPPNQAFRGLNTASTARGGDFLNPAEIALAGVGIPLIFKGLQEFKKYASPDIFKTALKKIKGGTFTKKHYHSYKQKIDAIHGAGFFDSFLSGLVAPFRAASNISPIFGFGVDKLADAIGVPKKLGILGAGLSFKDDRFPFNNIVDPPKFAKSRPQIKDEDSHYKISATRTIIKNIPKNHYVSNPRTI